VTPSVLLVSDELAYLLTAYSSLQRDPRIGRIEATANRDEAVALVQTLRPDAVVVDVAATDTGGHALVGRFRKLDASMAVIVTYRKCDEEPMAVIAPTLMAHEVVSREAFTVERVVRAVQALMARHAASATAAAAAAL
jgi:DNA-binding NarL/FixJ family response regulator